jgi:hypothetical protein
LQTTALISAKLRFFSPFNGTKFCEYCEDQVDSQA